jgi:enoyl-[acyl-carrier protein] reductase II
VIAAGGIADARGVVAAMALGAAGVQIGTRFIATNECNAHVAFKRSLVEAGMDGTAVYCRGYHPSRALRTAAIARMLEMEEEGRPIEEIVAFRGRGRARAGCIEGNLQEGILPAGAAVGLVRSVKPAGEVVRELVEGCEQILAALRVELDRGENEPDLGESRAA